MVSTYFYLIGKKLHTLWFNAEEEEDLYKLQVYKLDANILEIFCSCLEAWDYSGDEQRKESLISMINHLKVIWVQYDNNLDDDDHLQHTWPKDIQDFDPLTFGLELKIQQSKPQIEQWCRFLLRLSLIQCKSSTNNHISSFVNSVPIRLRGFSIYGAARFKNHVKILEDKLAFLYNAGVDGCMIPSTKLLEYRDFVNAISSNAVFLTCMYWANEANEENATELNIALFDMLHKIRLRAADVTASYFAVLKSNNWLQSDHCTFEGRTLATLVDFFFEHTFLKDDFLILRERLILLFTYLTDDPPHENAQEEEVDVIRSQIHALLHEDAYLLLPISEMKEDFSNTKMLLSGFMIKIDILYTRIIKLYSRPSDSLYLMEVKKMNSVSLASVQRELFHRCKWSDQVHLYQMEIRFLRSFFQCFETWDDSDEETKVQLRTVFISLQRIWGLVPGHIYAIGKEDIADQEHLLDSELKEKFQMSKKEINVWLASLSHCSFNCRPSTSKKILEFLDSLLYNMSDLVDFGACKYDAASKKQIEILKKKLLLVSNLLKLAKNCADSKNLEEFNMFAQALVNNAACLIYVYWAKEANGEFLAETNLMFSNMLQKIKPDRPAVARIYIGTLKSICLQPYDSYLLEQTAMSFVDYFFEDLVTHWKNDVQVLRDEVIFYLTFVHHHHTRNAGEMICIQLDVLFSDAVYGLLPFEDLKGDFSKKKVGLSDFLMSIQTENARIRNLYCKFPDSFVHNFPRIIGQGFLDYLMQKLRNLTERMISDQKSVPFELMTIEKEMVYLTPIFLSNLRVE